MSGKESTVDNRVKPVRKRIKRPRNLRMEYQVWKSMMARCHNPNHNRFPGYGGRGIAVCERWHDFNNFAEDMAPRPPGMSIDRIDNDKGYCPENCRWADNKQQNRNRKDNHLVTRDGVTMCIAEWAEKAGIESSVVYSRMNRGMSLHDAISFPKGPKGRHAPKTVTINGISKTVPEWAQVSGIDRKTIYYRIRNNWNSSDLLNPVQNPKKVQRG